MEVTILILALCMLSAVPDYYVDAIFGNLPGLGTQLLSLRFAPYCEGNLLILLADDAVY